MNNNQEAYRIMKEIDDEFDMDIRRYETSDIRRLRDKLIWFLDLRVETEDIMLSDAPNWNTEDI